MIYNALDIKKFRKKYNLTQQELAEILGISFRTVQNYESGRAIPKNKHALLNEVFTKYNAKTVLNDNEIDYSISKKSNIQYNIVVNTWKEMLIEIDTIIKNINKEPAGIDKIQRLRDAELTKLKLLQDLEDLKK